MGAIVSEARRHGRNQDGGQQPQKKLWASFGEEKLPILIPMAKLGWLGEGVGARGDRPDVLFFCPSCIRNRYRDTFGLASKHDSHSKPLRLWSPCPGLRYAHTSGGGGRLMGRMDQQGLRGEIDGCYCPGDVKVLGENLRITAACVSALSDRRAVIVRPLSAVSIARVLSSDPQENGEVFGEEVPKETHGRVRPLLIESSGTRPRRSSRPLHCRMGALAGGLEAFEQFFSHLPLDTGLAFVLVPHLEPTHKGMMPELLGRHTKMPVVEVEDGMKVQPNHVYVIPPNADLAILHGKLQVLEPVAPRGQRMPIDFFFRHLAADQKEKAIGIILSGMGSDGTLGLKAIKENLGMAMVQDPASAKYDSMPRSAINTGMVDYIAAAQELPAKLIQYVTHAPAARREACSGRGGTNCRARKGLCPSACPHRQRLFLLQEQHDRPPDRTPHERPPV